MSIDRYAQNLIDRAERQRRGPATGYPMPGKSQDFTLSQSKRLDIAVLGWTIRTIVVTNLTPFFLHFPDNPVGFQWVLPGILGAAIPVVTDPVRVNSIDVPSGAAVPASSTQIAGLTALEDPLPYSPGTPYVSAPNLVPNKPAQGFQLVAGANQVLITGITNQTIYIFDISLGNDTVVAAGSTLFRDSTHNICFMSTTTLNPAAFDGKGCPLTVSDSLFVTVPAGTAVRGAVSYSQA
jgi:hypothetical protein